MFGRARLARSCDVVLPSRLFSPGTCDTNNISTVDPEQTWHHLRDPFHQGHVTKSTKIEILSNASNPSSQRKKHSRNMMRHVPTSTIGAKLRSDFAVETLFTRDTKQNTNLDSWSGTNMASPERPLSPRTCHRIYIIQILLGASKPFSHRTCCKCALPKA